MPMVLVATMPDGQCTTNRVGSYVESEITIFSMELALTVLDAQCTTNGVGSYIGKGITISSMVLGLTLRVRLQYPQWGWLIWCQMPNVPPMELALTLMGGMLTTSFFRKIDSWNVQFSS